MSDLQKSYSFQSDKQFPILHSQVQRYIAEIRHTPIIADADVAVLYGVETKRVNEAVRNNPDKFPEDYMFVLTTDELQDLRSKISSTNVSTKSRRTYQYIHLWTTSRKTSSIGTIRKVFEVHEALQEANESINKLGLVPVSFITQ